MSTNDEQDLDRFTRLVERVLKVPFAVATMLDGTTKVLDRAIEFLGPWLEPSEVQLAGSLCELVVLTRHTVVTSTRVSGQRAAPDIDKNSDAFEIGYAGVPLVASDQHLLGVLCVVDHPRRSWSDEHVTALEQFSAMMVAKIERRYRQLEQLLHDERLWDLFDAANAEVALCAADGRVQRASNAFCALAGHSKEYVHGSRVAPLNDVGGTRVTWGSDEYVLSTIARAEHWRG